MGRSKTTFAHGIRGLDWNALHLILPICRSDSLSGAARTLGINHSTVSRKINAIEDKTGVRFFDRLPQGYLMTKAGHAAHEHAQRIEKEVDDLSRKILAQDATLSGPIRLTCSEGLAVELAPKLVPEFCRISIALTELLKCKTAMSHNLVCNISGSVDFKCSINHLKW